MNKWQRFYCDIHFRGKEPRSKHEKNKFELLGQIKDEISVELPDGVKTYKVTECNCDMPNGLISVDVLVPNLILWISRGYKITSFVGQKGTVHN